jgi:hypothetical protein
VQDAVDLAYLGEEVADLVLDGDVAIFKAHGRLFLVGQVLAAVKKDPLHALALDGVDHVAAHFLDHLTRCIGDFKTGANLSGRPRFAMGESNDFSPQKESGFSPIRCCRKICKYGRVMGVWT